MYTWEIDDLVRARGNILSVQEYIQVFRSPQVDHVKRDGDRVQIWTKDGGFWEIEIKEVGFRGLGNRLSFCAISHRKENMIWVGRNIETY